MKWIPEGAVTGHRSKRPNVSGPQSECAGLEAYSAIESTSLCLPTLNSRSCDAGCEATATDRFTADDAEAGTSPARQDGDTSKQYGEPFMHREQR